MRKRTDGFTLVELMVVVLIIGILVAVAVPVFKAAREQAVANTCKANQRMLLGAVEAFKAQNPNACYLPGYQFDYQWGFVSQRLSTDVWAYHQGSWYSEGLGPTDVYCWSARIVPNYLKSVPICPDAPSGGPASAGTVSTSWVMNRSATGTENQSPDYFTAPTAVYWGYAVSDAAVSTCCWRTSSWALYRVDHRL